MLRWTGALAWLSLALVLHNLWLGPTPHGGAGQGLLVAAGLALELTSVALPGFGLFSASPAPLLALSLVGGAGGSLATVALLLSCAILVGRLPQRGQTLSQLVTHALPVLAGIAAVEQAQRLFPASGPALYQALPWLVGPTAIVALQQALPRLLAPHLRGADRLAYTRVQRELRSLHLTSALAALPLAWVAGNSPLVGVPLVPLLFALQRAAQNEIFRVNAALALEARQALRDSQEALARLHREKDRTQAELLATEQERRSLEGLTRLLTEQVDLNSLGKLIFKTVSQSVPTRSMVIFELAGAQWSPVQSNSPLQQRLEATNLMGLVEPIVAQAQALGRPVSTAEEPMGQSAPHRLMQGENCAAAIPLGPRHVLYAGREQPQWNEGELRWMVWVCARASAALAAIEQQLRQKQELQQQSTARQALQEQVSWLEGMLQLSRRLAGSVDPTAIAAHTQKALEVLLPHQGGLLCDQKMEVRGRWGHLPMPWLHCLRGAAQVVLQYGKPLLIPHVAQSKFALPGAPSSLLCVPLIDESGISGALLLASAQADSFQPGQQDLLLIIASQCAVALSKAALFVALQESQAQVVQTSKLMAVGQLAAGVAHELNTPLGAISLMLEGATAQLEKSPSNAARKLERAQSALVRAKGIVEKLLVYSRKSDPQLTPVQPAEVVREAIDFIEPQLRKQGVKVQVEAPDTALIAGKNQDLEQVLVNLLLNAAEACQGRPEEARRILLGCRQQGEEVQFFVEDNGEGIPPEVLPRIFEPFFTTRPVGRGTGLGLSVSQQIAHQHGGQLQVQSQPGQGSRFILSVPVADISPKASEL